MLTLIKGRNGSGKTSWCLDQVIRRAREGKPSMLIVPQNMDYTFEVELVERLSPSERRFCEVTNFRKLCRDIIRKQGGDARAFLDVPERVTLLRRAVMSCSDQLSVYGRRGRDTSFYERLGVLFEELRSAKAGPEELRKVSAECPSDLSRQKFSEIALLLERYEEAVSTTYFDSVSEMEYAGSQCAASGLTAGKEIYLDGFVVLSTVMMQFICELIGCSGNVFLTVGCSGTPRDESGAFAASARSAKRLGAMVEERFGKWPTERVLPPDDSLKPSGIVNAERFFGTGELSEGRRGVTLLEAGTVYDEAEQCAEEILRLAREDGVRYREIAVLVRDLPTYREAIRRTFERFGIYYVLDAEETLEHAPCVTFLLAAFEMARGIRTDSLLRLLKTGLCDIGEEEVSNLENYAFVHDIEGERWNVPFTENPEGMGEIRHEGQKLLDATEAARRKVMEWMAPYLKKAENASGAFLLRAAYELLERVGGLEAMAENNEQGRCNAQLALDMIDRFDLVLGEEHVTRDELCDLLRIMARSNRAMSIPSKADAVIVGEADRTALLAPRIVFVLGLNDGVFPRETFEGNLFTMEERDLLYGNDYYVAGAFDEQVDIELNYLYRAVSAPTEKLYLSYAGKDSAGGSMQLCAEVAAFTEALGLEPKERSDAFGIVNQRTAEIRYADALDREKRELMKALEDSEAGDACRELILTAERRDRKIADQELAARLAGDRQRLSASKIEDFEECRFRFFARYLLNLQPLRRAEISPLEAGNFVHDVMENMMKETDGDLLSLSESQLTLLCARLSDSYMDRMVPAENRSRRMQALCDAIKTAVCRLGLRLREEQKQSDFRPVGFEMKIGEDGEVPGTEVELEDGSTAVIDGKIDRVDLYERDGERYVRVVDYKTGEKDFRLSDVWQGLNIQMLVYLFALKNGGANLLGGELKTAGVLYMPSDPRPESNQAEAKKQYRMKGLLIDDPDVLRAMESEGKGLFIPATRNNNGTWKTDNLATLEQFGKIERRIDDLIREMAQAVRSGDLEANPIEIQSGSKHDPCEYCDYKSMCDHERVISKGLNRPIEKLQNDEMFGEEEQDG